MLLQSEVESLARESAEGGVDEKRHGKKKAEMASVVRGVLHKAKARVASETETQGKIKSLNRTASSIGQSPRTARSTISVSVRCTQSCVAASVRNPSHCACNAGIWGGRACAAEAAGGVQGARRDDEEAVRS